MLCVYPLGNPHGDSVALMNLNATLLGHGILVETDGKIRDLLVPGQKGFGFGKHGTAPATGCVAAEYEAATVHGR